MDSAAKLASSPETVISRAPPALATLAPRHGSGWPSWVIVNEKSVGSVLSTRIGTRPLSNSTAELFRTVSFR